MIHRELYFATPVYIKDVGTQEYNDYLTDVSFLCKSLC
jgi:hypothetical protein